MPGFRQQGQSCGAWCLAHRIALDKGALLLQKNFFVTLAKQIYSQVQFADNGDATLHGFFVAQLSDPWKIIKRLINEGLAPSPPKLYVPTQPMQAFVPALQAVTLVKGEGDVVQKDNMPQQMGAGDSYVICICATLQQPPGLHYLLVRKAGGNWEVYDPNYDDLVFTPLGSAPLAQNLIQGLVQYMYLGAFILC